MISSCSTVGLSVKIGVQGGVISGLMLPPVNLRVGTVIVFKLTLKLGRAGHFGFGPISGTWRALKSTSGQPPVDPKIPALSGFSPTQL